MQVQRKRHIGNDIVIVVFQTEGCPPLDVETFASKCTHAILLVRVAGAGTPAMTYRFA
jgi:RAP1 GTPase activating protein 1